MEHTKNNSGKTNVNSNGCRKYREDFKIKFKQSLIPLIVLTMFIGNIQSIRVYAVDENNNDNIGSISMGEGININEENEEENGEIIETVEEEQGEDVEGDGQGEEGQGEEGQGEEGQVGDDDNSDEDEEDDESTVISEFEDRLNTLKGRNKDENLIIDLNKLKNDVTNSNINDGDKDTLIVDINDELVVTTEKIFGDRLSMLESERLWNNALLRDLEDLRYEVRNSVLITEIKRGQFINDIDTHITKVEDYMDKEDKSKFSASAIKKDVKIELENGALYIRLPYLDSGYEYEYTIYDGYRSIDSGTTSNYIVLYNVSGEKSLQLEAYIISSRTGNRILEFDVKIDINDKEPPVIECVYVEDSKLYIEISDNFGFDSRPITYRLKDDKEDTVMKKDYIIIDIPVEIEITVEDSFGNKVKEKFNITNDNTILKGEPSRKVLNRLDGKRESKVEKLEGCRNIIIVEQGKRANLLEELKSLALDKFGRYNDGDVTLNAGKLKKDGDYIEFDIEGLHEIKIEHTFYKKDGISVYLLVEGDSIQYTNIDKIEVANPYLVYKDNVKLSEYLKFELVRSEYEPKIDFIFAQKSGDAEVFPVNKDIKLEKDKINSFIIYDTLSGDKFNIDLKVEEQDGKLETAAFSDVTFKHWAYNDIKDLTLKQLIQGYPDETFKPDNNISVKEFMTMLSRLIAKNEVESTVVKNFKEPGLIKEDWAYIEVKSILNKLSDGNLLKFNKTNLDRHITREEVAFLISNVVELKTGHIRENRSLNDVISSQYYLEINELINNGIIQGYPDNTFKPKNNITRAEVSAMFNRML